MQPASANASLFCTLFLGCMAFTVKYLITSQSVIGISGWITIIQDCYTATSTAFFR